MKVTVLKSNDLGLSPGLGLWGWYDPLCGRSLRGDEAISNVTEGPPFPWPQASVWKNRHCKNLLYPCQSGLHILRTEGLIYQIGLFGRKNWASKAQSRLGFPFLQNSSVEVCLLPCCGCEGGCVCKEASVSRRWSHCRYKTMFPNLTYPEERRYFDLHLPASCGSQLILNVGRENCFYLLDPQGPTNKCILFIFLIHVEGGVLNSLWNCIWTKGQIILDVWTKF